MMRQSEFKRKYDPELGKYTKKHIYGEGIIDKVKSFFKPTPNTSNPKKPPEKPKKVRFEQLNHSASNKKGDDKIVKLLSQEYSKPLRKKIVRQAPKMSQQEINNRVLQIMSGGKIAK